MMLGCKATCMDAVLVTAAWCLGASVATLRFVREIEYASVPSLSRITGALPQDEKVQHCGQADARRSKAKAKHLDYDLKPLEVDSFSHYIEPIVSDERFRVH